MFTMIKRSLSLLLAVALTLQPVVSYAGPIVVDTAAPVSRQATLDTAPNGVGVVNITAPTLGGVSRNKFSEFNVGKEGVVMNNSLVVGVSQLGGVLLGNPNFTNGQGANIILNEVTGANRSELLGATEIFGNRAEYILANPNGITCNGCGFINTPRVTLSTGIPEMQNGNLLGFDVDGGDVRIEGLDANFTNIDAFDIISRTASIASAVHAATSVNITTGRNHVDYATRAATAKADDGSAKPIVAVDTSALGGMYAGRIKLVATEAGVGVKTDGELVASSGNAVITADGDIAYTNVAAAKDIKITSAGKVSQTGDAYAGNKLALAGKDIALQGGLAGAGQEVGLDAAGSITNEGEIVSGGTLKADSGQDFTNRGLVKAADASIKAGNIDNSNTYTHDGSKGMYADKVKLDATGDITNSNGAVSGAEVALTAGNKVTNSGLVKGSNSVAVNAATVDNSFSYVTGADGALTKGIVSGGALAVTATGDVTNNNGAMAGKSVAVNAATLTNQNGLVQGEKNIAVNAGSIDNSNTYTTGAKPYGILSDGTVALDAEDIDNTEGFISGSDVNLAAANSLVNSGLVQSSGNMAVTAGSITNSGTYQLTDGGIAKGLVSGGTLALTSTMGSIDNSAGAIDSRGAFNIVSADGLDNTGGYISSASANSASSIIATGALNNSNGKILSAFDLDVTAASGSNTDGLISSLTQLTLAFIASEFTNSSGDIYAEESFTATNINNQGGVIQAGDSIEITNGSGVFDNSSGKVLAFNEASTVSITADNNIINTGGTIISNTSTSLVLNDSYIIDGTILTGGHIDITATGITNNANVEAGDYISFFLTGGDFLNSSGARLVSGTSIAINAQAGNIINNGEIAAPDMVLEVANGNLTNSGVISSSGLLNADISGTITNTGRISAAGDLTTRSTTLNNTGQIASDGALAITTTGNTIHNNGGVLYATDDLILHSAVIENTNADIFSLDGDIVMELDTGLQNTSITNTSGSIEAMSGNIIINTQSLTNQRSHFATVAEPLRDANGDLVVYTHVWEGTWPSLNVVLPATDESYYYGDGSKRHDKFYMYRLQGANAPAATILAGNDITITAGNVLNDGAQIAANHDLTLNASGTVTNRSRRIQEWGYYFLDTNKDDEWYISMHTSFDDPQPFENFGFTFADATARATISAGNTLTGNIRNLINEDIYEGGQGPSIAALSGNTSSSALGDGFKRTDVNNTQLDTASLGTIPLPYTSGAVVDTGQFVDIDALGNGMFTIDNAPGANYLIETNVEFIDLNRFYGSDYFLSRIGYTLPNDIKLLGDAFYETKLVRSAIFDRTGQRYLHDGIGADFDQMQQLYENAADAMSGLQLTVGIGLNAAQVAALTSDIIWLVEDVVNGQKVLKPVLYLAQATLDGLNGNGASIIAGNDLTLNVADAATNSGTLKAGRDLSLTTQNDIANTGKIQAGRNVQLVSTAGSISNNAAVHTSASESGNYVSSFLQRVGEIISGGDTTLVAQQDITNTGGNITTGNNLNLIAEEGNVIIDSAELHNREEKRGKRHYKLDDTVEHAGSNITAGNDVNIAAAKDVAVLGSVVTAAGDAKIQAGNDLFIGAVANEETHVTQYTKKSIQKTTSYKKETYDLTHQGAEINAGGNVNLASGGDMGVIGSTVTSGENTNLATNGQLVIASTQDVHESHEEKKTKSSFVGKWLMDNAWGSFGSKDRKETHDIVHTTQNGANLDAGQDLSTLSGDDTTLIASHLKAGGAVNITTAPGSSVNLLAANNTEYESHTKSSKSTMWQAQSGSGHTSETAQMNTVESASLNIDTGHINVDVAANPNTKALPLEGGGLGGGDSSIGAAISQVLHQAEAANAPPPNVQDIINSAATQPGLEYLNQLKSDPRVNWNVVNNAYESWDYKSQGLTQEGAAIIAIAVTIATMGAGAALAGAATTAGAAAGTAGAAAATVGAATAGTVAAAGAGSAFAAGTIGAAAANAAFSALAAQAAVTLVNNRGNIGRTFEDLASSNTVKSVAFAALTAGATQGLGNAAGLSGIAVPDMTIGQQATHIGINAGVSSTAQSLIYGEDFGSSLGRNLLTSTVAVAGAEGSRAIGDLYHAGTIGKPEQLLLHSVVGCAQGAAISGNCGAGAAGQVAGELAAGAYLNGNLATLENRETALDIAEISGALGGLVAGGDADDIYASSRFGRTAAENNVIPVAIAYGVEACMVNPACVAAAASLATATGIALANAYYQISEWAYSNNVNTGTYEFNGGGSSAAKQNPVGGSVAATGGPGLEPDEEPGDWEPNQDKIKNIIDETQNNNGDITSNYTISEDEFFNLAEEWLGKDYKEVGRPGQGVYRSADGTKQLRIDNNSLLGNHSPGESHVHLEIVNPTGRGKPITNNHIILRK